jgi:hypothetical protein
VTGVRHPLAKSYHHCIVIHSIRWLALVANPRAPWVVVAGVCMIAPLQNVYLSGFTGQPGPLWKVWIYELSSGTVLLALVPWVAWMSGRFPLRAFSPAIAVTHVAGSILFSAVHVSAMVMIRKAVFALLGDRYDFGPALTGFAYEYGKDVFSYASFLGIFTLSDWIREAIARRAETRGARAAGGVTVKTSRGNVLVPFDAIIHVEASGNYVTLCTASGQFLHRATMKDVERLLPTSDFARSHRSHLVRVASICGITTGSDGDRMLELVGGGRVPLSRTYAAARDWTLTAHAGAGSEAGAGLRTSIGGSNVRFGPGTGA